MTATTPGSTRLRPVVSRFKLLIFGIGTVVGAGIFSIIGVATRHAGPSLVLGLLLIGLQSASIAFCYAELSTCFPFTGSTYAYTYAFWGRLPAWIVGMCVVFDYSIAAAAIVRSWSEYFAALLTMMKIPYPTVLIDYKFGTGFDAYFAVDATAAVMIIILTMVSCLKIEGSMTTVMVLTVMKLGALLLFIMYGFSHFDTNNFAVFFPHGSEGMFQGSAVMLMAYSGIEGISLLAEESENPRRDMPFATIGTLFSCMVIYCLTAVALIALVPYDKVDTNDPLISALKPNWAKGIVAFAATVGLVTAIIGCIVGQARIYLAMSRDGLLPPIFCRLSPAWGSPIVATLLTGAFVFVFALFFDIDFLGDMCSLGISVAFLAANLLVLYRRWTPVESKTQVSIWIGLLVVSSFAMGICVHHRAPMWCSITFGVCVLAVMVRCHFFKVASLKQLQEQKREWTNQHSSRGEEDQVDGLLVDEAKGGDVDDETMATDTTSLIHRGSSSSTKLEQGSDVRSTNSDIDVGFLCPLFPLVPMVGTVYGEYVMASVGFTAFAALMIFLTVMMIPYYIMRNNRRITS